MREGSLRGFLEFCVADGFTLALAVLLIFVGSGECSGTAHKLMRDFGSVSGMVL